MTIKNKYFIRSRLSLLKEPEFSSLIGITKNLVKKAPGFRTKFIQDIQSIKHISYFQTLFFLKCLKSGHFLNMAGIADPEKVKIILIVLAFSGIFTKSCIQLAARECKKDRLKVCTKTCGKTFNVFQDQFSSNFL